MSRRHEYDQHFLRSPRLVGTLVGHSDLKKRDLVLDIGAGSGVISHVLARRVRQVLAIEPESAALMKLGDNLADARNVTIIAKDFFKTDLPNEPYKVFSNIPFRESARIITLLTSHENTPSSIYLIVQKQFAYKLLAENRGFHSQLGMLLAPRWQARIRYRLQKSDFTPPPAVDTVLLELKKRPEPLLDEAEFAQYKTMIEQNFTDPNVFIKHGFASGIKPSQLTFSEWLMVFGRQPKS